MASSRPPFEEIERVYRRLVAGEADAPSDLIDLLLVPLIRMFSQKYPSFPDPDAVSDLVTDSLLKFVQEPSRYQPEKRGLWGYLLMDIEGDLRNRLRSLQRKRGAEVTLDSVALSLLDGNKSVEEAIVEKLTPLMLPDGSDGATFLAQLREDLDERDWEAVILMAQGERATEAYATVFGITDRPVADQRKLVKQAKDRLRLKLKRRGVKIHER